MRFRRAMDEALMGVNEANWRDRLEQLHGEHRTWDATARALNVSPATLRRYRAGGYSRGGGRRKALSPEKLLPKIGSALRKDRRAAVRGADWKRLSIVGTWTLDGRYSRRQRMDLGRYLTEDDTAALADAYVSGSDTRMTGAVDYFLADGYAPHLSDAHLTDVESLEI